MADFPRDLEATFDASARLVSDLHEVAVDAAGAMVDIAGRPTTPRDVADQLIERAGEVSSGIRDAQARWQEHVPTIEGT